MTRSMRLPNAPAKAKANSTVHFMEMVRTASTTNATQAAIASREISHVMPEPMPSEAPGLRTNVNESRPGITRMVRPSANADKAHILVSWSIAIAAIAIHAKTATRSRSRL